MRENKHTPGPWEARYHEPGNKLQHGLAGYSIQGLEGIAYHVSREANARLIAAAPELLEAAQAAYVYFLMAGPRRTRGICGRHAEALRAAIAKATEGGS